MRNVFKTVLKKDWAGGNVPKGPLQAAGGSFCLLWAQWLSAEECINYHILVIFFLLSASPVRVFLDAILKASLRWNWQRYWMLIWLAVYYSTSWRYDNGDDNGGDVEREMAQITRASFFLWKRVNFFQFQQKLYPAWPTPSSSAQLDIYRFSKRVLNYIWGNGGGGRCDISAYYKAFERYWKRNGSNKKSQLLSLKKGMF